MLRYFQCLLDLNAKCYSLYKVKMIPIIIKVIRSHSNCRTINDRPNTASRISSVSQIAAVTPAGKARNKVGCVAPCEKQKHFVRLMAK